MPKIESLEDLQAERFRLQGRAKELEDKLQSDARAWSEQLKPLYVAFDWLRKGKIAGIFGGVAGVLDAIGSGKKNKTALWSALGGIALNLVLSKFDLPQIFTWTISKFMGKEQNPDAHGK